MFFDTLGIGSFATTTAIFRAWRLVPDELIPGTLNVGPRDRVGALRVRLHRSGACRREHADSDGRRLGAWRMARIGRRRRAAQGPHQARHGSRAHRRGLADADDAARASSAGADALGLDWPLLGIAVAGNFVLGALMTLGIGLYAPCMILVSLLGLNPKAAFPIMMGSCAGLMPMAAARFVKTGRYHPSASVGLTLGGIPALFIAAYLVKSLPLGAIRWLVIVVVVYTAITLIRAGYRELSGARPQQFCGPDSVSS